MTTREPTWLCSTCGYAMDAATSLTEEGRIPKDGDIAVCMNCTAVYERSGKAWQSMWRSAEAELPPEVRREILLIRIAKALSGLPDLSKRDPRA